MMRWLAAIVLRLAGWRTAYVTPPGPKSVIVVYPHTSNWDFVLGVLFMARHRVNLNWAGKDTLFRWPFKRFFVWLGGVPTNRRERTGLIGQLLDAFAQSESFCMVIAPEGTRSKCDHWKTGFYRLTLEAGVPLGLGFIDYASKRVGVERWVKLSGDEETDLAMFRTYYSAFKARYPEKAGDICFKQRRAE